jgi:hypothetical protein
MYVQCVYACTKKRQIRNLKFKKIQNSKITKFRITKLKFTYLLKFKIKIQNLKKLGIARIGDWRI